MKNYHATCIVLADRGVLIEGAPGSGKSTLAFALVENRLAAGGHAAFVADDQLFLAARGGRVVARAPASIDGLAELHGLGIVAVPHAGRAVVDLAVTLSSESLERMPERASARFCGVELPHLVAPARSAEVASRLVRGLLREMSNGESDVEGTILSIAEQKTGLSTQPASTR